MNNSTNSLPNRWTEYPIKQLEFVVAYASLLNVTLGLLGNSICFVVLATSKDLKRMSYAIYLMYCSIANIISLFQWNLNHFLYPLFYFIIEDKGLIACRLFSFLQFFSLECSAYLLSWMCIDRFVTVIAVPGSRASRLPFSTPKTAHFWSILTILSIFLLHSHILILNGYYDPPEQLNVTILLSPNQSVRVTYQYQNPNYHCYNNSPTYSIFRVWDMLHLYLYTIIPFFIMITFNSLLIVKSSLMRAKATHSLVIRMSKVCTEKRRLSRSLLILTMSFLLMTSPASIAYGYLEEIYKSVEFRVTLHFLDCLSFFHQASFFFNCFLANKQFRRKVLDLWRTRVIGSGHHRWSNTVHPQHQNKHSITIITNLINNQKITSCQIN